MEAEQEGLEGLVVGIPAARRAEETAVLVRRWGGTALIGPTVEERPVEDDGPLHAATREVLTAPAAWSVHLTGVGTRRWFERARTWGLLPQLLDVLRRARVVARGGKARRALGEHGLDTDWSPPAETSAEIAAWLAPQVVPDETVALQRHGEPSRVLTEALTTAGARLVEVVTYRWSLPD